VDVFFMNRTLITFTIFIAVILSNLTIAFSQTDVNKSSTSQPQKAIDRKELESFLDKFFAEQMPKYKVPGAVFVIVKDGKVSSPKDSDTPTLKRRSRLTRTKPCSVLILFPNLSRQRR